MLTDEQSRELIVSDINSNYFVEASAGSGKTYSLVLRMVAMIEGNDKSDPIPVDQICTITFTKAAAAEFFSRFQKALSLRSVPQQYDIDKHFPPKTKETMERCRKALENIDLCFLGTIDAFCNMIAHELPTQFGIPSDAEVVSNDDKTRLLQEVYENIIKDESNPYHQKALLFEELNYNARDIFCATALHLGDLRNGTITFNDDLVDVDVNDYFAKQEKDEFLIYAKALSTDDVVFKKVSAVARNKIKTTLKNLLPKIDKKDWSRALGDVSFAVKQILDMEGFDSAVLHTKADSTGVFEHPAEVNGRTTIHYSDQAKECFEKIKEKIQSYNFALLVDLVTSVINDVFDGFKEQGKLGFFDYLYYLTLKLKEDFYGDRVIIDHILKRHSRFLLDESQDTNPLQTEFFFYITGTNKKAKDWIDAKPKDGSLFIVGDPKQSIYGFRGANVQAFNRVKDIFDKEGKVLVLTKNFRSKEILKQWFNDSMNDVLNHGIEPLIHLDIPLNANKMAKEAGQFVVNKRNVYLYQGVYKYSVICQGGNGTNEDPEAVAKFIVDMVDNPNKIIQVKNPKTDKLEERMITYGDIRVVPRSTNVKKYIDAFNRYHIPVIIEAKIPFDRSKTLSMANDIVCLLKMPGDKATLLNVLYGELFKLNDLDILSMKAKGFKFDISLEPITLGNQHLQDIINLLHKLWKETQGFSFSSTLLYILNNKELNIYNYVSTDFFEYTFFFIEKVKEKEEAGLISGIDQFKQYVSDFCNNNTDDSRTVRFKESANRVILANLHKVKGLQAPVVILCGPRRDGKKSIQRVDYNNGQPVANLSAITDDDFNPLAQRHDVNQAEQDIWDAYDRAEKERVEYVGATRAESVLIVADRTPSDNPSTAEYPPYNPWEDLIRNIPNNQLITVPNVTPANVTPIRVSLNNPLDFNASKQQSTVYSSPSKKVGDVKAESNNNNLDEIKDNADTGLSTKAGTLIHRLMECLVSAREHPFKDISLLVDQIVGEYNAKEFKPVLMEVADVVVNKGGYAENKSDIKDIYSVLLKAEEVYCETPFSYKKGNEIINGVIDLIYKDKNGYHIIDYKTNKESDIAFLEEHYKGQLQDYIDVLKEMGIESDAHIYHISYTR